MLMINCRWWLVSQNQEPKHGLLKLDLRAHQEIKTSQSRTLMPDVCFFPSGMMEVTQRTMTCFKDL